MTISSVIELSEFSRLSVASYALFDQAIPTVALRDNASMTETQAADFLDKYRIVHQAPNDSDGFSATIFQDKISGKLIFSVRGTEIPSDIVNDLLVSDILQIGPEGYAKSQATSMYRYWKQLTTAGGEAVSYSESEVAILYAISKGLSDLVSFDFGTVDYLSFRSSVLQDKGIEAGQATGAALISPNAVVDVAGHSLGGHLAMLFARFFPDNTGEVVTLNAPGFFAGSVLLTALGFPPPQDGKITRLEADGDGISEVGMPGFWPGTKIVLAQENEPGVVASISSNHSSVNGNDALALMRVIAKLDPELEKNISKLSDLVRAASSMPGNSYEKLLDGLRKLILGPNVSATRITTGTDPVERESYYLNLKNLQLDARFKQAVGLVAVESLVDFDQGELLAEANTSIAYRYALAELNSFAVTGVSSLYEQHNENGRLDLYDRQTGTGQVTQQWLTDRAELLHWKLELGLIDGVTDPQVPYVDGDHALRLEDRASGLVVQLLNVGDVPNVVFGAEGADAISAPTGTQVGHRFYGGDGNDVLKGGNGKDYLEGGTGSDKLDGGADSDTLLGMSGNDTLIGGQGNDTLVGGADNDRYEFSEGDGNDLVIDSDGQGSLWLDGRSLTGGKEIVNGAGLWRSEGGEVTYNLVPSADQTQTLYIQYRGGLIQIRDYRNGLMGVSLQEGDASPVPSTIQTFVGDKEAVDHDPDKEGIQAKSDELGNLIVSAVEEVRRDRIYGTEGSDLIQGLGDNDSLYGKGGDDHLQGGNGNDQIYGDSGRDLLVGGAGTDTLWGGADDDWLYANEQVDIASVIQQEQGTGVRGDVALGGDGADVLVGDAGNDDLMGDGGRDTIWGGAGDDVIYGDYGFVDYASGIGSVRIEGLELKLNQLKAFMNLTPPTSLDAPDSDNLFGGAGNDFIHGHEGNDWLYGGAGQDTLFGGADSDMLFGGANNDVMSGDVGFYNYFEIIIDDPDRPDIWAFESAQVIKQGNDTMDGGDGNDWLQGESGDDLLIGGTGNDTLLGDAVYLKGEDQHNDILEGGAGDDLLVGGGGHDSLSGGADNDVLFGDAGAFDFDGQYHGKDTLDGGDGNDTLIGGFNDDTLLGGTGDDLLFGDFSGEVPSTYAGNDFLNGGVGNDTLLGNGGNDTLLGGEGDDHLEDLDGENLFEGGAGDDTLIGGAQADHYRFGTGSERDVSYDRGGANILSFGAGISLANLAINVVGNQILRFATSAGDELLLVNYGAWAASRFEFADGTRYTLEQLLVRVSQALQLTGDEGANQLLGGSGGDSLSGGAGDDLLVGGMGRDTLIGGAGNDQYRLSANDGNDVIDDNLGQNSLLFGAGISRESVSFRLEYSIAGEPYLQANYPGGRVSIRNGVFGSISSFQFADGSSLDLKEVMKGVSPVSLNGPAEASILYGSDGADQLNGGDGGDLIEGQGGNDNLRGNAGEDVLRGEAGDDQLFGGDGQDSLYGGEGDDLLNGGRGNDILVGGTGTNQYVFARDSGFDTLQLHENETALLRLASNIEAADLLSRREANDLIIGLKGGSAEIRLQGYYGTAASVLVANATTAPQLLEDYLKQLSVTPSMSLDSWERDFKQQFINDYEQSLLSAGYELGADGYFYIQYVSDSKFRHVESISAYAISYIAGEVIDGEVWNNIQRDQKSESYVRDVSLLQASSSFTQLLSGGQEVESVGQYIPNRITPEVDDFPQLSSVGTHGGQLYAVEDDNGNVQGWWYFPVVFGALGGAQSIVKSFTHTTTKILRQYQVVHAGDEGAEVSVGDGNIYYAGAGNDVIRGMFLLTESGEGPALEHIGAMLSGGFGADIVLGGNGNDLLIGGGGDDIIRGHQGRDTYLFMHGDGVDVVLDEKYVPENSEYIPVEWSQQAFASELEDVVVLPEDAALADLSISWGTILIEGNYQDDILQGAFNPMLRAQMLYTTLDISWGTGQVIRIVMPHADDVVGSGIEFIRFADGTQMSMQDFISATKLGDTPDPYAQAVEIRASLTLDLVSNQWLPLIGGRGNDTLFGSLNDDSLVGGAGNDWLDGGEGGDLYLFGPGFGQDTITGWQGRNGERDSILLQRGVSSEDVLFKQEVDDLRISVRETDDSILVKGYFSSGDLADESSGLIRFAEGEFTNYGLILNLLFPATSPALPAALVEIYGSAGNDYLSARIEGSALYGYSGNDDLRGNAGSDYLSGGAGADNLFGGNGDDSLVGGSGNDYLSGGDGSDIYYFGRGGGNDRIYDQPSDYSAEKRDAIVFERDVFSNHVALGLDGRDLVLTIRDTGDTLRIFNYFWFGDENTRPYGIPEIRFYDGVVWSFNEVLSLISPTAGDDYLVGASDSSFLSGLDGDDTIIGGSGNDTLHGAAGNDWLNGGLGNDTYIFGRGDGVDEINSTLGFWENRLDKQDVILFAGDITAADIEVSRRWYDLILTVRDTGDQLNVQGYFSNAEDVPRIVQKIVFADGTEWHYPWLLSQVGPTAGDDFISGSNGSDLLEGFAGSDYLWGEGGGDTLDGGAGDDFLDGGSGTNTYIFGVGAGRDTIMSRWVDQDTVDIVRFTEGVSPSDITVTRQSADLVLTIVSSGDVLTIEKYFTDEGLQDFSQSFLTRIEFADGMAWESADINGSITQPVGSDSDDELMGAAGSDVILGLAGNDSLYGGLGDDSLIGGEGDDELDGGSGDDILDGGAGSDFMYGGEGRDTYLFNVGSGYDFIENYDPLTGAEDTLQFGAGITAGQIWFRQSDSNLEVSIIGTDDSVTLYGWYNSEDYGVGKIRSGDGSVLLGSQVNSLVDAMAAFGAPAGGEVSMTAQQRQQLDVVIAANWV